MAAPKHTGKIETEKATTVPDFEFERRRQWTLDFDEASISQRPLKKICSPQHMISFSSNQQQLRQYKVQPIHTTKLY
ncbi:hypothetical protein GQ457_06G004670 [Hibiscus cannabinus]